MFTSHGRDRPNPQHPRSRQEAGQQQGTANVRPMPVRLSLRSPTAQILLAEEAQTPFRRLLMELGFGLGTCVHPLTGSTPAQRRLAGQARTAGHTGLTGPANGLASGGRGPA